MISVSNLAKRVSVASGELVILKDVSLEIESSETVAIVGASGSGKSTLLGLLAGLDHASEGTVSIDGVSLQSLDEDGRAELRGEK
ncbi:MAG: ATP-binding cassette domain-containing protein, partial [Pseudomonadota bacterium]